MTGFVFLRVRAHRLLLAAALLAVLLTTSVLAATLAAFSGAIGDAALQAGLRGRSAAAASSSVRGQVPAEKRASADAAVEDGTRKTFDGLPVTVRRLERSEPYALPRALQPPAARKGDPDLTQFAALDRSRLSLVKGSWPACSPRPGAHRPDLRRRGPHAGPPRRASRHRRSRRHHADVLPAQLQRLGLRLRAERRRRAAGGGPPSAAPHRRTGGRPAPYSVILPARTPCTTWGPTSSPC
ncbi:hypothetical protein STANM309S_01960 [Streptomyces tanashiensis]